MHVSLFRALGAVDEPGLDEVGEDAEAVAHPDAAVDEGTEDEVLEGIEDGLDDEEIVDEVAAESMATVPG
jgi:hypothetical protein